MTNIGIFDSGLGGLAVLKEIIKDHKANYFYLADNKNAPYGDKSNEEITDLAKKIVKFLLKKDIDFFIIACNTISVVAKDELEKSFDTKFITIASQAIKAVERSSGDVYIMATKATCDKHFYKDTIEKNFDKKVIEMSCPKLVDYIEKGEISDEKLTYHLKEYLSLANEKKIENIVLACTHYPIIIDQIEKNLTYKANLIDPAKILNENLSFETNDKTNIEIYMTKPNEISLNMAKKIMGMDIDIKKAII